MLGGVRVDLFGSFLVQLLDGREIEDDRTRAVGSVQILDLVTRV